MYIGRPGPWGNPFRIDHDGDRNEVIRRYRIWLTTTPEGQRILEKAKVELVGKVQHNDHFINWLTNSRFSHVGALLKHVMATSLLN